MKRSLILPVSLSLAATVTAQDLCQGTGVGGAYLEIGPAYIGGPYAHDLGSPNVPNGFVFFAFTDGFAVTTTPFLGDVCFATDSPAWSVLILPTDGTGNVNVTFTLPSDPLLASFQNFYSHAVTFEDSQWSVSKTVPLYWQNADSWAETQAMSSKRFHHTATPLFEDGRDNENRILVVGGSETGTPTVPSALATTEYFHPVNRSFSPGPDLSVARTAHTATKLQDGRILIAGGLDEVGVCHTTCEIFDPSTGGFEPTGDMTTRRAGHAATLLDDGRVLVSGGVFDYQNPSGSAGFDAAMNTAQDTMEVFDPVTESWTAIAGAMQSTRTGHTQTLLDDGTVLIVAGAFGASSGSAILTATCELFDPVTDTHVPAPSLTHDTGYHGVSKLANGDVLVTGGFRNSGGVTTEHSNCWRYDGTSWTEVGGLSIGVAWHSQIALDNGDALIISGLNGALVGTSRVGIHDGTSYTALTALGENVGLPGVEDHARGVSSITRGFDGTYLLLGGYADPGILAPGTTGTTGMIYTPPMP